MNGLFRRLTRRRAAPAAEPPPETPDVSTGAAAETAGPEGASDVHERLEELRRRRRDLPAGVDLEELEARSGEGSRRGALRRRVRYLRRVRELLLRDLGGFYYEVHRAGTTHGGHRDILETKAGRLDVIDQELRELETRLNETYSGQTVLREPGIGGTCPSCGELHASDAGWCAHCGTPLTERARQRAAQDVDREIAARREREAERARAEQARVEAERAEQARAEAERAEQTRAEAERAEQARAGSESDTPGELNDERESGDAATTELPAGDDSATVGERGR